MGPEVLPFQQAPSCSHLVKTQLLGSGEYIMRREVAGD